MTRLFDEIEIVRAHLAAVDARLIDDPCDHELLDARAMLICWLLNNGPVERFNEPY